MVNCKFCNQDNLEWYQDSQEKWRLGIKIDVNSYKQHRCSPPQTKEITNNKRNWVVFNCEKCGNETRQNIKLLKPKELNLCYDCSNSC